MNAISGLSHDDCLDCLEALRKLMASGRVTRQALAEVLTDLGNEGFEIRKVGDDDGPHNYTTSELLQIIRAR